MKILSYANAIKKKKKSNNKKAEGFQISHFYWLFPSDVTAVKGLIGRKAGDHRGEYYNQVQHQLHLNCKEKP